MYQASGDYSNCTLQQPCVGSLAPFQMSIGGVPYYWESPGGLYRLVNGNRIPVTDRAEQDAFQRFMDTNHPQPQGVFDPSTGMYNYAAWTPPSIMSPGTAANAIRTVAPAEPFGSSISSTTLAIGGAALVLLLVLSRR